MYTVNIHDTASYNYYRVNNTCPPLTWISCGVSGRSSSCSDHMMSSGNGNGMKRIEMGTYCVGGSPQTAQGEVVPWPGPNERVHLTQ